jgi:hypothetical protein
MRPRGALGRGEQMARLRPRLEVLGRRAVLVGSGSGSQQESGRRAATPRLSRASRGRTTTFGDEVKWVGHDAPTWEPAGEFLAGGHRHWAKQRAGGRLDLRQKIQNKK